ncbi:MAG: hypothetical protein AAF512_21080 [Pseudomonadota bacterium]
MSTISRIFRVPGYAGNETSRTLLTQLHEKVVRPPFPAYLEKLFTRYDVWREKMTKKEFGEQLSTLEPLLRNHRALDAEPSLETCRISWLLGHIYFHRAFYLKRDPVNAEANALEWYQRALDTLDLLADENLLIQQYKVRQCIVSVQFNSCAPGSRSESAEIRRWLEGMDYLSVVTEVINEDSWNWSAARNGLIAASILQDAESCMLFWRAMQVAHHQFCDPYFQPMSDLPAIADEPDLIWFNENVLDT